MRGGIILKLTNRQKKLGAALLFVLLVDILGIYLLARHHALLKVVHVADLNSATVGHQVSRLNHKQKEELRGELERAGLGSHEVEKKVQKTMEWVMNQCGKIELYSLGNAYDALQYARQGGGLSCAPMADIFHESLTLLGMKARKVLLVRSFLNPYDNHMTVEAFIDGRWQIYDPTFHVSFVKSSEPARFLSAIEMNEALIQGSFSEIQPVFFGEVSYPARLEEYRIHYLPLFNNVLILHEEGLSLWRRLPPLRYFFGPVYMYQTPLNQKKQPLFLMVYREIYFIVVLFIPVLGMVIAAAIVIDAINAFFRRRFRSQTRELSRE